MNTFKPLSKISFKNDFITNLPGDSILSRESRTVINSCFSLIEPEKTPEEKLLGWSQDLAQKFGIEKPEIESESLKILTGNLLLSSMKPFAACYGGHQFGHWAGQLGDGRAIVLGELRDLSGNSWELQLKGAGRTPYSRYADGRAVLRSSVREFLASEAMFHLGVPTTRALSLTSTGSSVVRDMFYDGNPIEEQGAITSRLAPCFIRFGNFEILSSRQDYTNLEKLVNWVIDTQFTEIQELKDYSNDPKKRILFWFQEICRRTAIMICEWERVGFVHGVMNTDNMSILGLTIDYGPFGWMDSFDPNWTPNTTDLPRRRYCFGRQASIALWNLERLAEALIPIVGDSQFFNSGLEFYIKTYQTLRLKMLENKLGLQSLSGEKDQKFIEDLFELLETGDVDMTIFYRKLSELNYLELEGTQKNKDIENFNVTILRESFYQEPREDFLKKLEGWLSDYLLRVQNEGIDPEVRKVQMNKVNPKFIPRNYLLFEVIQNMEQGDHKMFEEFYQVLRNPYDENSNLERFSQKRPDWAKTKAGCSTLSCSS